MVEPSEVGSGGVRENTSESGSSDTANLLGFELRTGSPESIVEFLWQKIRLGQPTHVVTLNPEMVIAARRSVDVRSILQCADIFVADGVGLEWAAKVLRADSVSRIPGVDLALALMSRLAAVQGSVFLLGSKPGVAEQAAAKLTQQLPGLTIAGAEDGYYDQAREPEIISNIADQHPDMLLVGLGSPRQEGLIVRYRDELRVPLMIGVGGALEVYAGVKRRAPEFWRKTGLEWAYRSIQDISRLKRLGVLPRFIWLVLRQRMSGVAA